ncbi:MAG TPA: cobalt-precorrin 5A hydrolase [Bacillota bacterium]|nr:cobalt-precorrin 5A hydrolase [Bacillota bacterium]
MKIALISFTGAGAKTCHIIEEGLKSRCHDCSASGKAPFAAEAGIKPLNCSLDQWAAGAFSEAGGLVFVGATGIAVRAIAPYLRDKTVDPAVVVVDERGKYAISLLSGHLGGANDLAGEIAGLIGAEAVITTATDINHRFAVDGWAKKNRLQIGDMAMAKEISAAILRGETVGVSSDEPIEGELPEQLSAESGLKVGFRISIYEGDGPFEQTLHLIPRTVTVGIGCRKGASPQAVEELFEKVMKEHGISIKSVERICSIDIKKEEPALKRLAEKLGVPLEVFSAGELNQAEGDFTSSEFVNRITGVDNVCERAAVLGSRGELIVRKEALNGVTVAMAARTETGGYRWKHQ